SCYNVDGSNPTYSPNDAACKLLTRYPDGTIDTITVTTANLARFETSGYDMQLDWGVPMDAIGLPASLGSLSLNAVVNYTDHYRIQSTASSPILEYAGTIGNEQIELNAI